MSSFLPSFQICNYALEDPEANILTTDIRSLLDLLPNLRLKTAVPCVSHSLTPLLLFSVWFLLYMGHLNVSNGTVPIRDELIHARETPADIPIVTIDAQEYTTRNTNSLLCFGKNKKTPSDCYKAKSATKLEEIIKKAALNLGLPSEQQWRIEYSTTSTVTLKNSTRTISFSGPKICEGKCTAYDLTGNGLPTAVRNPQNIEIYPNLCYELKEKYISPTIKISAYYNLPQKKGNPGKMVERPKPSAATTLEKLLTEAGPKLGLPSGGMWRFKYSDNSQDLPAFYNADFKGVVPFTGPEGKYTADLATNRIKDDQGKVIVEVKRSSSGAEIAPVERL
ncbi:hypothetical protein BT96DRAFT_1012560 [Gymnopus androsaceus JB14]|uniref:Uncharacterized protein n=1 Tax=Gymnopus androsaceus JB14 TaxID=1447944 RepID=A0A6A4IFZ9_9AGAR|nr:hypothetical protein BT96DRAFT_1012560 [Gymnopus androsaceus JB14]